MRQARVWARSLGLQQAVIEGVLMGTEGEVLVRARPRSARRRRCGVCDRRCPGYDAGDGPRRWRAADVGTSLAYVLADAPRVRCPAHGVVVAGVPWARHGSRFTHAFEDQTAWLAVHCSKTAVSELMRISWRTVGGICARVCQEAKAGVDLLDGLRRIGIDDFSHRRGHRYLTVVIDHDSGRLVWASEGRGRETVTRFLHDLGPERRQALELISADMAAWIATPLAEGCPHATLCVDPFHVVQLATRALDDVRRQVWNTTRRHGPKGQALLLQRARFVLWKNPENLTERQHTKLAHIQHTNAPLYRAYLLKEQLRQIYRLPAPEALEHLRQWLLWARRSRLPAFTKLAKTITDRYTGIAAAITHGLSNARIEAINTHMRLITRRAYGFHSAQALIALAMLSLAGLCPPLPH